MQHLSGILMTVCYAGCYIPQIIKLYRTKSSTDLSGGLIWMSIMGAVFGIIYASHTINNSWLFVSYGIGLFLSLILLYLYKKYR
jgi:uncharacterized protein with PQ loop repeat